MKRPTCGRQDRRELHTAALKTPHPDLHEQYMKTIQSKPAVVPVRHRGYRL